MADPKTQIVPFSLQGLVTKADPTRLGPGQYPFVSNMESQQEGMLATRAGRKLLGTGPATTDVVYMIRKLRAGVSETPTTPASNPRYVGMVTASTTADIYRTVNYTAFTLVATGVDSGSNYIEKRWNLAEYSGGESGSFWAFIASENKMLRDNWSSGASPYSTLPRWGHLPAWGVASAAAGAAGKLDGGDTASPAQSTPYDWRYTFVDDLTGNESNPSQVMQVGSANAPLKTNLTAATVTVYGFYDTTQYKKIAIYRRGGLLYDTWRLVGYVANPGQTGGVITGDPTSTTFSDNVADTDLVYAKQLEFDHDPPVLSTLQSPYVSTVNGAVAGTGWQTVVLTGAMPSQVTIGSLMTIGGPGGVGQVCVIMKVISTTQVRTYLTTVLAGGESVSIGAACGQPCPLCLSAFSSLFVAGDPYNPAILYKSKTGYPEYFPLATDGGVVNQIQVGTPSNGIVNMTEFRGNLLCMNVSNFFEIGVQAGTMYGPFVTPAKRGLAARYAWCVADNEIWYLAHDGVWSWDGATSTKRSEAIDPIFHGQITDTGKHADNTYGVPPLDYTPSNLQWAQMEYYRGEIRLLYRDVGGKSWVLRCNPLYGDRWTFEDHRKQPGDRIVTFLYREPDTETLIMAREDATISSPTNPPVFAIADQTQVSGADNYTTDDFTGTLASPGVGDLIPFEFRTPWFDMGNPHMKKLFTEVILDIDPQLSATLTNLPTIDVDMYVDFESSTSVYNFGIDAPALGTLKGRIPISCLPNLTNVSSTYQSFGKECRAMQFKFSGNAYLTQIKFYNLIFTYIEVGMLTAGACSDWDNMGSERDKKLYQMRVSFDTLGSDHIIVLDTLSGRDGKVYTQRAGSADFVCSNPSSGPPTGSSTRVFKTFPIPDGVICKAARVRHVSTAAGLTSSTTTFFKILSVQFDKEDYPPDIVAFTPWEDGGTEYDKYLQQIDLTVNTNNVAVTVIAQADGTGSTYDKFTFTVTATESDRRRNITVPPGLSGKQWRLYINPTQTALTTGTGMFQLFSHSFKFQKADPGEVGHSFDWDDLGHPYDKQLLTVTIEYDCTTNVTMQLDLKVGINGAGTTTNVAQFVLDGNTRGKVTFPIAPDTVAKMIRLYPVGTPPVTYKQWKYSWQKIDYPPDIVHVTEWRDAEAPTDKEPSWLWIDADTNNIAASVILQNEDGTVMTVSHTGTYRDRRRDYAIPVDTRAKMWRLRPTEGTGGRFQLFNWGFARWQPYDQLSPTDPPDVILSTPWSDFGYPYDKLARNLIVTLNTGGVPCQVGLQTSELGVVETFSVTTSYTNRRVVLPCTSNLTGKLWRLAFTPGTNGLAQLWDWTLDAIKEPAAVTSWDSYEQNFGYKFWKICKQAWWMVQCTSPITVVMTSDTGTFTTTLPASFVRSEFRYYLPVVFGIGLNKSKLYRLQLSAATPFKFYTQGSGFEFIPVGAELHAGYQQISVSEFMTLGEGQ